MRRQVVVADRLPVACGPRCVGVTIPGSGPSGRADIVVSGIEQVRATFELRVFVNNPTADAQTPRSAMQGFVGSISVNGDGRLLPGEHIPMTRDLVATYAIQAAARQGPAATITLVPVVISGDESEVDLSRVEVSLRIHEVH